MEKVVVFISGKQGGGKTATAKYLRKLFEEFGFAVENLKFADPLYDIHNFIVNYLAPYGYKPEVKWGTLLQYIGTEFGRNQLDQQIWVKILAHKCAHFFSGLGRFIGHPRAVVIVDDLRFKNEFECPIEEGTTVVRIRLEAPESVRKPRCENWRDNTTHQSEIDLDDWLEKFDLVLDTSKHPVQSQADLLQFLQQRGILKGREHEL